MDPTLLNHDTDAIESLLRSIPEQWRVFEHDTLTSTEQRALFLLVAAGLIERRYGFHLEMAGQTSIIEAALSVTGEHGLVEALDPLLAQVWTKWSQAFKEWKSGDAASSSPFRVFRTGPDEWRLTEHGVLARTDLGVDAPSDGAATFVGCRQRALEFILCAGYQEDRPPVRGEGRLIQLNTVDDAAARHASSVAGKSTLTEVSLANASEIAAAFRDSLMPELLAAIGRCTISDEPANDAHASGRSQDRLDHETDEFGGPETDEHDERVAWMLGKRIYLGRDTQLSRLFWLLTSPIGRAHHEAEIQRAVDGVETSAYIESDPKEIERAKVRMRKAISKLRDRLREAELDDHMVIVRDGPNQAPMYTMVMRHARPC